MVIYVRHGATVLNGEGDTSAERLRGWLPVPLDAEGKAAAQAVASKLTGTKVDSARTSDLVRAQQTAQIISQALQQPIPDDPRVRDWNTGQLAGQLVKQVLPQIKALIFQPKTTPPGGEPFQAYLDRFVPLMTQLVEDPGTHLVVGHARGSSVLEGLARSDGNLDKELLTRKPTLQPAGIMRISPQWDIVIDPPTRQETINAEVAR